MKLKRNLLLGIFCSVLNMVYILAVPVQAQTKAQPALTDYTGNIEVLPNVDLRQTTIVLTSPVALKAASNQIVFVLLGTDNHSSWSGNGRILVGDGVLAVLEKSATNADDGLLFKFAERLSPPSLEKIPLKINSVIGIARYGENNPLTENQIENLANTGRFSRSKDLLSHSVFSNSIHVQLVPVQGGCSSGGEGATACGAGGGGCTVSCGAGTFACCNFASNNCTCKIVPVLPGLL
jgi:hypothetical protein